jgi:protein O-mannosyl-transferase
MAMRHFGLGARVWNAGRSLGFYLAKLVLPINLVPFYPLDYEISPRQWSCALSILLILAASAAAVATRRRMPQIGALLAAYVVMLLPVLGLVQVGQQAAADRYMYLPMLIPAIGVASLSLRLWHGGRARRALSTACALIAVAGLSALSIRQIGVWRDSFTLWSWVIQKQPNVAIAHYNLGQHLRSKGDLEGAGQSWRRASQLEPSFSWPLNQLGALAMLQGKTDEARRFYEQAIQVNARDAAAQFNYATLLADEGHVEEARRHYEIFLKVATPNLAHLLPEVRSRLALPAHPSVQPPTGVSP